MCLRPADLLLYAWDRGRDVRVDLIGSSPLTRSGMLDFVPGQVVAQAAKRKCVKYRDLCAPKGYGNGGENEESPMKIQSFPLSEDGNTAQQPKQETEFEPGPENLARSVPPEISPSSSPKCHTLFSKCEEFDDGPGEKSVSGQEEKKRKKKRARKKRHGPNEDERNKKEELVWLYPFTNSSSASQRKIKQQYDQLVRSHGSNGLTPDQVGQFVNCLVEATNELQNKSRIYKLELEQKRLQEDAFVYNWLQEELVTLAYKKMLEIGACMETEGKRSSLVESTDTDSYDISFEELLAQEKKDAFWLAVNLEYHELFLI
ncbi:hypothetical protein OROHE_003933 [Orobanche hederae]